MQGDKRRMQALAQCVVEHARPAGRPTGTAPHLYLARQVAVGGDDRHLYDCVLFEVETWTWANAVSKCIGLQIWK